MQWGYTLTTFLGQGLKKKRKKINITTLLLYKCSGNIRYYNWMRGQTKRHKYRKQPPVKNTVEVKIIYG